LQGIRIFLLHIYSRTQPKYTMRKNSITFIVVLVTTIYNPTLWPAGLVSAGLQSSQAVAASLHYAGISSQIKITSGNTIGKRNTVIETAHRRPHYFLTNRYNHIITSGASQADNGS